MTLLHDRQSICHFIRVPHLCVCACVCVSVAVWMHVCNCVCVKCTYICMCMSDHMIVCVYK